LASSTNQDRGGSTHRGSRGSGRCKCNAIAGYLAFTPWAEIFIEKKLCKHNNYRLSSKPIHSQPIHSQTTIASAMRELPVQVLFDLCHPTAEAQPLVLQQFKVLLQHRHVQRKLRCYRFQSDRFWSLEPKTPNFNLEAELEHQRKTQKHHQP